MSLILGCRKRLWCWIVGWVPFLLCIWGCLLVVMLVVYLFGNRLLAVLNLDCPVGNRSICLWVVVWCFWSLSCHHCLFILFPSSRLHQASSPLLNLFLTVFYGVGSDDHRKISWVDWKTVCRSKEVGGLG